jgi:SET domain-containing protein
MIIFTKDLKYKDKYLKYKNKYLKLKGGSDDIFTDKRLYIGKSKLDGAEWGVFASEPISKGTVIEITRTLKLKDNHLSHDDNILNDYVYKLDDDHSVIALGYGSLFNHNDDPHIEFDIMDNKISYTAIKDIKPDEELFISYGDEWWQNRKGKKEETKEKEEEEETDEEKNSNHKN